MGTVLQLFERCLARFEGSCADKKMTGRSNLSIRRPRHQQASMSVPDHGNCIDHAGVDAFAQDRLRS